MEKDKAHASKSVIRSRWGGGKRLVRRFYSFRSKERVLCERGALVRWYGRFSCLTTRPLFVNFPGYFCPFDLFSSESEDSVRACVCEGGEWNSAAIHTYIIRICIHTHTNVRIRVSSPNRTGERRRSSNAARPFRRVSGPESVGGRGGRRSSVPQVVAVRVQNNNNTRTLPRYDVEHYTNAAGRWWSPHGSVSKRGRVATIPNIRTHFCVRSPHVYARRAHYRRSFYFIIILHASAGGSRRAFIGLAFALLSAPGRDFVHDILRYGYGIVVVVRTPVPE